MAPAAVSTIGGAALLDNSLVANRSFSSAALRTRGRSVSSRYFQGVILLNINIKPSVSVWPSWNEKSRVKKEEDEVGRAAIAAFDRLVGGYEPRVLGQSRYASATSPATTTHWSHTAASQAPRRSSRHECLRRALVEDQDKQIIVLPGACVRRNGMIVDVSRTSLLPSPTRPSHHAARRLCSSQRHE
ncbi:hypothetical protein MTO96_035123 [Rhipicephalus appendiculatus]